MLYSTTDVRPHERLSFWLDVATKGFVSHAFRARSPLNFQGCVQLGLLGDVGFAVYEAEACEVSRTRQDIVRDNVDDLLLIHQLEGRSVIAQDDRQVVNEGGSFSLVDTRRPFTVDFQGHPQDSSRTHRNLCLKIPRRALEARIGSVAGLTARVLNVNRPVVGLASGFLALLTERADKLEGPASTKITEQALDLVSLAFACETQAQSPALSSHSALTLFRLKYVIEAHLYDPQFKPAAAAAAAGLSVRYANALLSLEGTSLERYIVRRRLDRCRLALEDPAQAHRMIGDIAFSWGFSELSHFCRRFKTEFGCTPREYRDSRKYTRP